MSVPGLSFLDPRIPKNEPIVYFNIYDTRSTGRCCDLLMAQYAPVQAVEAKLRVTVALLISTGLRLVGIAKSREPLQFEAAQNETDLFVCVRLNFAPMAGMKPDAWEALARPIHPYTQEFKTFLHKPSASLYLFVRMSKATSNEKLPIAVEELESIETTVETTHQFRELGDLDYQRLLENVRNSENKIEAQSGEIISGVLQTEELKTKVGGAAPELEDGKITISGSSGVEEESNRIVSAKSSEPEIDISQVIKSLPDTRASEADLGVMPELDLGAEELVNTVRGQIEDGVAEDLQKMAGSVKQSAADVENSDNPKESARKMADTMLRELMEQKAKLVEFGKQMNLTLKKKEEEFKVKGQAAEEELRKRDSLLKQKESGITHLKTQIVMVGKQLDKYRKLAQAAQADASIKARYHELLGSFRKLKEEKEGISKELAQLRVKADSAADDRGLPPAVQVKITSLQTKLDHATKQADQFQKLNKQLMDRISASEKAGSNSDELKHKLNQAGKVSAEAKKEAEAFRARFEDAKRDVTRLQSEVAELTQKLKVAQVKSGSKAA